LNVELNDDPLKSSKLIDSLKFGTNEHVVIPWSVLSGRNQRALKETLRSQTFEAGIELGFTVTDLGPISIQDILDVRNIGFGTVRSLIAEIQIALDKILSNPSIYNPNNIFWDLLIGASILRKDLHDRFGGVREGGISPVDKKSRNILIFTSPHVGVSHGYEPDIWLNDDTFLYCGEGQSGDQEMVRYNKSILQHVERDKVLRVFDGTRGEVVYQGAFELDQENPWFHKEGFGLDGKSRKVIMFRMLRIDSTAKGLKDEIPSEGGFSWNCETHSSSGAASTVEEIEHLATSHMRFRDNSVQDCEIRISRPESNFEDLDEESLVRRNRNREMADLRLSGISLEAIGSQFGVTRERVRQILQKVDGPTVHDLKVLRESIKVEQLSTLRSQVLDLVKKNPRLTLNEVSSLLKVSVSDVTKILSARDLKLFSRALRQSPSKWSDEEIVSILQEASTLEFPLTVAAYSKLLEEGYLKGPSAARVSQRFRSWQEACDFAGVEPGSRTRPLDTSRWTDEDLKASIILYLNLPQSSGAVGDYDFWASGQDDVPSSGTLRKRLGPWNLIRNQAIERMRNEN
jgi:transcriptional regulator with XRE-family HTH domain